MKIDENNCKDCLHIEACSKWTDFPKQLGFPICRNYRKQSEPISCDHEKGLILTIDGASGYFPKEFIIEAIKTHMSQSKGRWTPRHKDTKAFCTKCGALRDIETQEFWSFCPNCGAKMKGGEE